MCGVDRLLEAMGAPNSRCTYRVTVSPGQLVYLNSELYAR